MDELIAINAMLNVAIEKAHDATVDALSASLNDACERCQFAFRTVEAEYNAVQQGIMGSNLALDSAMENLKHACEYFDLVSKNTRRYINGRRIELQQRQHQSDLNANVVYPTAAEPASIRPVAVHRTVAEQAPVRPVVTDVSEEHNTAAPEETVNLNTAAPEETVEHNTAASKVTGAQLGCA